MNVFEGVKQSYRSSFAAFIQNNLLWIEMQVIKQEL